MLVKHKFRDDVRLAVELFGVNQLAKELEIMPGAIARWLRGSTIPDEGSKIYNKLAFLLKE